MSDGMTFQVVWSEDWDSGEEAANPHIAGAVYNDEKERWEITLESLADLPALGREYSTAVTVYFLDPNEEDYELPVCVLES